MKQGMKIAPKKELKCLQKRFKRKFENFTIKNSDERNLWEKSLRNGTGTKSFYFSA